MKKNGNSLDLERYRWTDEKERAVVLTNLHKTGVNRIAEMRAKLFPRDPVSEHDRLHARADALISHLQTVVEQAISETLDEARSARQPLVVEVGAGDGEVIHGLMAKLRPSMRGSLKVMALDPHHDLKSRNGILFIKGSVDDLACNIRETGRASILINTADPHHAGTTEQIRARIRALSSFVRPCGRLILTDTVHGEDSSSWRRDFETTIACHNDTDEMGHDLPRAQTYLKPSDIREILLEAGMSIEQELARSPSIGAREYHHTFLARKTVS